MSEFARGQVVSINVSAEKGVRKTPVERTELVLDRGLLGDAHAGDWHRQVSLLALESVERMREAGADVAPGDFAENLTLSGIELVTLPLGTSIEIGSAMVEISQHGKECHSHCAIYHQVGDCVMPREGVFAVVKRPGVVAVGDAAVVRQLGTGTFARAGSKAT